MKRAEFYNTYFNEDKGVIFNPLFWHLSKYLNDPDVRYIFLPGGSSAGKTYTISQLTSIESYVNKYNCYIMRKYNVTIKDSVYTDYKDFNNSLKEQSNSRLGGLFSDIIAIEGAIKSERNLLRFRGLDKSEKLKGIAAFTKVFMDEITEFDHQDFKQVRKRLRGRKNQQIIASWNPIDENHWIKKKVIDTYGWIEQPKEIEGIPQSRLSENSHVRINTQGNAVEIKTTYLDNYWVVGHKKGGFQDKHVIADFEEDKKNDPNNYKIYALGEYGTCTEGLAFSENTNWSIYSELPDYDFYETYGLDFAGGSSSDSRKTYPEYWKFDEADGSTTTVLVRLMINKASMSCYIKLLLYKEYIDPNDLAKACEKATITEENGEYLKKNILADNARKDKITDLMMSGIIVIGAKTGEGGSNQVKTGVDIMKKYKLYIHVDDVPAIMSMRNHKKEVSKSTGEFTGNYEEKYKDFIDAVRYPLVYFDLFGW
jgi:PBSX family phage terminase large subunit